jgi:hypothetical protein
MNDRLKTGFADRLKTAAAAKRALLDQLRPMPAQIDPDHERRAALRAAEREAALEAVRQQRAAAKAAKRQAAADAALEIELARAAAEEAELLAKRGQRKERKALSAAEAKAKRDAKYAARKMRA